MPEQIRLGLGEVRERGGVEERQNRPAAQAGQPERRSVPGASAWWRRRRHRVRLPSFPVRIGLQRLARLRAFERSHLPSVPPSANEPGQDRRERGHEQGVHDHFHSLDHPFLSNPGRQFDAVTTAHVYPPAFPGSRAARRRTATSSRSTSEDGGAAPSVQERMKLPCGQRSRANRSSSQPLHGRFSGVPWRRGGP